MQLGMELSQKQTLKITLTPELRQSITILQYSSRELVNYLQQQTVENPLLDVKEKDMESWGFPSSHSLKPSFSPHLGEKDEDPFRHYSNTKITLEKHLMEQVMTLKYLTSLQKQILHFLIGNLNQHGFLEMEPAIAARMFSVPLTEMEKEIQRLQSFDPIGVGARNLVDCLLIQLRERKQQQSLAYQIVKNHLDDLAAKHYHKLAKCFDCRLQEVQEAADLIKSLNPRPCSEFFYEMTQYIAPDVIVEMIENKYLIIINDEMMPDVSINHFYRNHLSRNVDADEYVKEKYHDAMILMNGIAQRKQTLFKVAKAIMDRQKEFLKKGMIGLKPMTLRDVAEQLGLHESTISRATSNKYIQTPHGLFKLKNLFSTGISRTNSYETDSAVVVKQKIKGLIHGENKQKPLSDQKLVEFLEKSGILISRRTVAKYREEIGIPGSSKRRRFS